ncbi:MAG: alpha/beta fold hydrolase [Thermomicrobiales bacterium]
MTEDLAPTSITEAMTFTDGKHTLAGTLHLPASDVPPSGWPALVMIAGSGDSDRDASGWFVPIRDAFLTNGIAVLSWDKPGCGGSSGHWTTQTFSHRATEAIAGLAWLRAHSHIDAARTGLWGHSQGGWIGPIVAARDPELRALVVNSGPAVDVHAQDLFGVEHTMRDAGRSDAEIRRALAATERLHGAAIAGLSFSQLERMLPDLHAKDGPLDYFGGLTPAIWHFFCLNANPVLDPMDVIPLIRCATLAVYGSDDPLTPPEQSAALFRQAFDRPDAPPLTIRIYPHAGHRIETKGPGTYADGYLADLGTWMADALR